MQPVRLVGLDALRGIAAVTVLLSHLDQARGVPGDWMLGAVSVDLFFAISGYVMAAAYGDRLAQGLTTRAFMAARLKRLWPIHAFGCALGAAALLARGFESPRVALATGLAVLFLPAPFLTDRVFPVNLPGWSLTFELAANWLHATVLETLSTRNLAWVCFGCCAAHAAVILLTGYPASGGQFKYWFPAAFRTIGLYSAGMLLFRARAAERLRIPGWSALVIFPALVALLPRGGIETLLLVALCPLLVVGAAQMKRVPRPLMVLGAISYPLYVVHRPLIDLLQEGSPAAVILAVIAAATILALIADPRRFGRAMGSPASVVRLASSGSGRMGAAVVSDR